MDFGDLRLDGLEHSQKPKGGIASDTLFLPHAIARCLAAYLASVMSREGVSSVNVGLHSGSSFRRGEWRSMRCHASGELGEEGPLSRWTIPLG